MLGDGRPDCDFCMGAMHKDLAIAHLSLALSKSLQGCVIYRLAEKIGNKDCVTQVVSSLTRVDY